MVIQCPRGIPRSYIAERKAAHQYINGTGGWKGVFKKIGEEWSNELQHGTPSKYFGKKCSRVSPKYPSGIRKKSTKVGPRTQKQKDRIAFRKYAKQNNLFKKNGKPINATAKRIAHFLNKPHIPRKKGPKKEPKKRTKKEEEILKNDNAVNFFFTVPKNDEKIAKSGWRKEPNIFQKGAKLNIE